MTLSNRKRVNSHRGQALDAFSQVRAKVKGLYPIVKGLTHTEDKPLAHQSQVRAKVQGLYQIVKGLTHTEDKPLANQSQVRAKGKGLYQIVKGLEPVQFTVCLKQSLEFVAETRIFTEIKTKIAEKIFSVGKKSTSIPFSMKLKTMDL